MNSSIGIGLLGCGTVGGGVADLLLKRGFALRAIAVRSLLKERPAVIPAVLFNRDADAIIDDPENDLIVECIGGLTDAAKFVERALRRGKHVVTANKDLIANEGPRLYALAARAGVSLQYEASVGGAIPIVRTLSESLASEEIFEVAGVLNGTSNFILTAIEAGSSYEDAVAQAQRRGYAEANPSNDVSGLDSAHKLAILSQLAFGRAVTTERIARCGLETIDREDIQFASSLGYAVKLLAFARNTAATYTAAVAPVCVPRPHPFAAPTGAENCIRLQGRSAGSLLFSGEGAGREPTASAVLSDVVAAMRAIAFGPQGSSAARALAPAGNVSPGLDALGRLVRFSSFRDARPAQTLLESCGYRTHSLERRSALHIFPQSSMDDAEILFVLARADIHPTSILPIWHDAPYSHAPVTDTIRTHRREKETVS